MDEDVKKRLIIILFVIFCIGVFITVVSAAAFGSGGDPDALYATIAGAAISGLVILVAFAIFMADLTGILCMEKGYNYDWGFKIGLVLGIWGWLYAHFLPNKKELHAKEVVYREIGSASQEINVYLKAKLLAEAQKNGNVVVEKPQEPVAPVKQSAEKPAKTSKQSGERPMKYCSYCGVYVRDMNNRCPKCGSRLD